MLGLVSYFIRQTCTRLSSDSAISHIKNNNCKDKIMQTVYSYRFVQLTQFITLLSYNIKRYGYESILVMCSVPFFGFINKF